MVDLLLWVMQNVALAPYHLFVAITNPQLWLAWGDREALARFMYYGASVELFFVFLTTFLVMTAVGLWRPGFMWGGVRVLERVANTVGRVAAWAGLVMVLQQIVIVFMQRVFAASEISLGFGAAFSFDVSWWAESLKLHNAIIICLCVAYTFVQGGHVRVDLVYSAVSHRAKRIMDMIGCVIFMVPMGVLIWLYGWFFMWRSLVVPNPAASSTLDRMLMQARALRWNVETIGFSPNGFNAYFLFKVLIVVFALMVLMQAVSFFWRSLLELREGEESAGRYLDRDVLGDEAETIAHDIHSGAT